MSNIYLKVTNEKMSGRYSKPQFSTFKNVASK